MSPQWTESRLSLCLAPQKDKTSGWKAQMQIGQLDRGDTFPTVLCICFWSTSRYNSVKISVLRWMEFYDWIGQCCCVQWQWSVNQGKNLKPHWRLISLHSLSIHQNRKSNWYGMTCSSINLDGCNPHISVCPSVNPIFTGPIPCVRYYTKCK